MFIKKNIQNSPLKKKKKRVKSGTYNNVIHFLSGFLEQGQIDSPQQFYKYIYIYIYFFLLSFFTITQYIVVTMSCA